MSSPSGSAKDRTGRDPRLTRKVTEFLTGIGIECRTGEIQGGFLQNVRIEKGGLVMNEHAKVSDILHEAGHIAIIPEALRDQANDDLSELENAIEHAMSQITYEQWASDDPAAKALLQLGDSEATAWAWAAGKHLEIPDELIIEDSDYDGEGSVIRFGLSLGQYVGINGLAAAGMIDNVRAYPQMKIWTQN